ncbi:agmatine deiminase family protein [Streptomyces sp. NPDC002130]|uniref:agmatine deiminase family protein n=1 Tax=Streptomyces sp. NPDC002130 TaxID=3155568 RepID=UPI00331C07B5
MNQCHDQFTELEFTQVTAENRGQGRCDLHTELIVVDLVVGCISQGSNSAGDTGEITVDEGGSEHVGHVDIVAAISSPGVVLVHDQRNPVHPDYAVSKRIIELFESSTDVGGRPWKVIRVPAPEILRDDEGFVDYSYINHLVVNRGVIACSFDDPADAEAVVFLSAGYPGRPVVTVDARPLFERGGGIHCITQHQPAEQD